jgi:thiamine-monophosphate kinase
MRMPIQPPDDNRVPNRIALAEVGPDARRLVSRVETAVEGVQFDASLLSPAEIGHRALASALSDLAAIGADPLYAQFNVGVRQETTDPFLAELEGGIRKLGEQFRMRVARGGFFPCPTALLVQVTVLGKRGKKDWSPATGAVGDRLFVLGTLGGALGAMTCLKRLGRHNLVGKEALLAAHTRPEPQVKAARWLRSIESRVKPSAVIDLQDGLAMDLARLARASGVGAEVDVTKLPIAEATRRAAELVRGMLDVWAVYGPEDYALLVAVPEKQADAFATAARRAKQPVAEVGRLCPKRERVTLRNREGERVGLEPRLWHPFVRRAPLRVVE